MFRTAISFGGLLLLAGATLLAAPGPGQARGGGFGRGGSFGGHYGGYRGGLYHGGYYGHAHAHYGYGGYYGGYSPYYGGYYTYPYASSSNAYDPDPNPWPTVTEDSGYRGSPASVTQPYRYGSTATAPPPGGSQLADTSAQVTVKVPAGARVSFDDVQTTTAGPVREFQTPPLIPGNWYTYEVQARWVDNGSEVRQKQQVDVAAGRHVTVTFPIPPRTAGQGSAALGR